MPTTATNHANFLPIDPASGRELVGDVSRFVAVERAAKGTVKVDVDRGWLRLRWSCQGRRFVLSLGLPDEPTNRTIADRKARLIETDIKLEQFDPTLDRYRSQVSTEGISVVSLFDQFTEFKRKQLDPASLDKYVGLMGHLKQFFREQKAVQVGEDKAFQFRDKLLKKLAPITVRERLTMLRSCWQWGVKRRLVRENPWLEVKVKVPPQQKPRPFTRSEVGRILQGFKEDKDYSYYTDLIEFLLSIGCRPGEAFGLRWKHLNADCSVIWIGEAWVRGRQKPTKTNEDRAFSLTPRLRQMLLDRRPQGYKPDDLVFPAKRGNPMDDHNFRRAWKIMLDKLGIEYRKPYNSRHSFVSHAVDRGLKPSEVSEISGHSEETIYRHYLGNVKGQVQLPELWGGDD
jgi:integrase